MSLSREERVKVNITLPKPLVGKARRLGLNISRVSENALEKAVEKMERE